MNKFIKVPMTNGYYLFKLDNLLKENNISKNKLMRDTNTDFKVIQRLTTGEMARVDIEVLARFCDYFNCPITDIIEYIPKKH